MGVCCLLLPVSFRIVKLAVGRCCHWGRCRGGVGFVFCLSCLERTVFRRADAVLVRVFVRVCAYVCVLVLLCVQREQIPVARKELHRLLENRYSPASSLCFFCVCVLVGE